VLEEERENMTRLEIRLKELQELSSRVAQQAAAAQAGLGAPPAYSAAEQEDLQLRVAEAAEAVGKLQVGGHGGVELSENRGGRCAGWGMVVCWHGAAGFGAALHTRCWLQVRGTGREQKVCHQGQVQQA